MVTKLEAGHWYKESNGSVWMYLRIDLYKKYMVMYKSGAIVGLGYDLNLFTLVEVCYVDGEEMVVGEKYYVATGSEEDAIANRINNTFAGVVDGKPIFAGKHPYSYIAWPYYVLAFSVSPVPTYHLVKSIDGKEVSRVEVSEKQAEEWREVE